MRPEDCHLLGCEMGGLLVLLMFAGMFGLTILPYVVEVVTRVVRVLITKAVMGMYPIMYLDNAMGASQRKTYVQDMEAVGGQIQLLGSKAEAKEKRESTEDNPGRELVCLRWVFLLILSRSDSRRKRTWVAV